MPENSEVNFNFSSVELFNFILKKFKLLAIITIAGAVISIIVSFSITPRFKSKVIMFPASSSSVSNDLLTNNLGSKNILKFGSEEESEQMLQVLYSDEVRSRIIKKFHLMQHYDIDSTSQFPLTKLYEEYKSNISFRRTEYLSVEVEVLDPNPQMAADIANEIAALTDTVMNRMQKERAGLALKLVGGEYTSLSRQITAMEDSLGQIRKKGINNYETQAQVYNSALAEAITKGNNAAVKALQQKIDTLSKYGGAYVSLRDRLIYETERISHLKAKYLEAKIDYEQKLPHKFIVDRAVRAEKKSKPVRWLIVSLSTLATFVFSLIVLIVLDALKNKFRLFS
ncbi:MAG: Wzz/FepE/Etk N-terminal domain-containing protein [Bacteroidia bacterium]|nr:Wzz/FepE/Etk N-terminal domain-containing protein [Bacteroidia bacterium]